MKQLKVLFLIVVLGACSKPREISPHNDIDTLSASELLPKVENNIFADSNFTFLALDSLSEQMLFSDEGGEKFLASRKPFKKEHCKFFKTGCYGYFFDDYVFLISKQNTLGDITPVIIHDSKDFGYYHSELFTIDKDNKKIDSAIVSLYGRSQDCDCDTSQVEHIQSRFIENKIITTAFTVVYKDADYLKTIDSTTVYRTITSEGKIIKDERP